ncbi:hypothetical protein FRX31_031511 [Thalictrum thalictroides]|uniref:Uncharacterized protein n=1 Tax=Thalictrum thalictroides TaxID=46969 RepID=A0A7J6V390_THATH|nr:hypothetical protein FRX31_031511 [Thalictrum thalictroides]
MRAAMTKNPNVGVRIGTKKSSKRNFDSAGSCEGGDIIPKHKSTKRFGKKTSIKENLRAGKKPCDEQYNSDSDADYFHGSSEEEHNGNDPRIGESSDEDNNENSSDEESDGNAKGRDHSSDEDLDGDFGDRVSSDEESADEADDSIQKQPSQANNEKMPRSDESRKSKRK